MEKESSHYLQNFAIQSQLSKRFASYPTLPHIIVGGAFQKKLLEQNNSLNGCTAMIR